MAQLLDSNCKRLSSLSVHCSCPECEPEYPSQVLKTFSGEIKHLRLDIPICRLHDVPPRWTNTVILESLIASPTVNTIEDLTLPAEFGNGDRIIMVLKHCSRLRVLRVLNYSRVYKGLDASDLLSSMEEPWKCQDTLEEL